MKQALFLSLATIVLFCIFPLALTAGPPLARLAEGGPRDTEAPPAKAGDNAPPKPDAGKPADEANGLKIELSVVNAPLYPGDDLQIDVRLTNVQKEGDIQIIDLPIQWISFSFVCIGPDGAQITWPEPKVMMERPQAPTATLPPGGFYGRKITLDASQMRKPGKYAISVRYNNSETLKDKGFNCWTGNLQSNTAFFEVPDFSNVPAVDGIKLLVKAKPQYREDEPVTIEIRLYNASDKDKGVCVPDDGFLMFSHAVPMVTNFDGRKILPKLPEEREVVLPAKNKLAPGRAFLHEYSLRDLVSPPVGKYALELHCDLPDLGQMTSNKVTFEIIPARTLMKDGLQMSIKMAKEKYAEKEPVKVAVRFKHVGDKTVLVLASKLTLSHFIAGSEVRNAAGNAVLWKAAPDGNLEEDGRVEFKAGDTLDEEFDLLAMYDLPVGKYTLIVHGAPDMEVTFEIIPAAKPKGPVKGSEGISEGPFHMTINMAKEKYAEGEPVKFTISMKNVSDKEQKVYISKESLRDFIARIVIKNAEGKTVPWKIAPDGTRSEYDTAKLQPGEVFNKEYDLLEACDLPVGKYTLQMHSIEPGRPDMEVTFEIIPAEKPPEAPQPAP